MSRLDLRFLGTPEVWSGQRLLKFPTRKALALLVYLAATGGWHSREKLMPLLWPESSPRRGQASLRNALARLRHALGEAEGYVLVEGELLSFDLAADVALDLQTVATAAEAQDIVPLQAAVDLYRGDFLEGFSLPDALAFDDWAGLQRQMSLILARLSGAQADGGNVHRKP